MNLEMKRRVLPFTEERRKKKPIKWISKQELTINYQQSDYRWKSHSYTVTVTAEKCISLPNIINNNQFYEFVCSDDEVKTTTGGSK